MQDPAVVHYEDLPGVARTLTWPGNFSPDVTEKIARAIANSPLVKTAWAGCDPNWGRLVAAIGYSGAEIDPDRIDIWFGEQRICRDGGRAAEFDEAAAHAYLRQTEYSISIDLNQGPGSCVFWTTDLTAEYVHINADYST